jgi:5-methyltetrahydropteroyltriglutamate--homocysteine methyltransferase
LQQGLGISHVPSGDFSLYDGVLDNACMLGAIPPGYGWNGGAVGLPTMFALARGSRNSPAEREAGIEPGLPALEMTKWFDTNYHYLVPRLIAEQRFELTGNRPLAMFQEALAAGQRTRPVLLGPVSFLRLSKSGDGSDPLDLLGRLLPIYAHVLRELVEAGCAWVQVDEPVLALDLGEKARIAVALAYDTLARGAAPNILLASYFGALGDNLPVAVRLPVAGLHLDLIRGATDLERVLEAIEPEQWLSLGIVDGRNVWRTDLRVALATLRRVADKRGTQRLMVAPSCSLLHVPVDLAQEMKLNPEVKAWLAFAVQKLNEVAVLVRGLDGGEAAIASELAASDAAVAARRASARVHRPEIAARLAAITPEMTQRASPFEVRRVRQRSRLNLPVFPTTTIGSFPQTAEVRRARAALAGAEITEADYDQAIKGWISEAVRWQEELGLDVLVHGEFERNDMVKYFAEQLEGYAFTQHGWVQSYGSRCVAPPIIWGDVSRPAPMTVRWSAYAQSLTKRPVKGMLTGPVTMLHGRSCATKCHANWSAVRLRSPSGTRSPIWKPRVSRSSRWTSRHSAKACRSAARIGTIICAGRSRVSSWRPATQETTRPSTLTCATLSSTTSCRRFPQWMQTRYRLKRPAAGWNCWMSLRTPARVTRQRSGPAYGTSTARACQTRRKWRRCLAWHAAACRIGRSGSTPIAV